MAGKIPPDALTFYIALGHGRNYQKVAERYGVSKRAVVQRAVKEGWQQKVAEHDEKVQKDANEKITETAAEMHIRHFKILKAIQAKSIGALQSLPVSSTAVAIRALTTSIKEERLLRNELDRSYSQGNLKRRLEERMAAYQGGPDNPIDTNNNVDQLREIVLSAYNEILESPDATVEERRHILDSISRLTGINIGRDENHVVSAQEHALQIQKFLNEIEKVTVVDVDSDEKQNPA